MSNEKKEFKVYSAAGIDRPVRLSEATRAFAFESMAGKYGEEAMTHFAVSIDGCLQWQMMDPYEQYDLCVDRIAYEAPVRVCPGELICGAATLGAAIRGAIPAVMNGRLVYGGVSHVTLGFDRVLKEGVNSYEKRIDARLSEKDLPDGQRRFLVSLKNTVRSFRAWHGRYLRAVKDDRPDLYENLKNVPFESPRTFREAVQALWFTFAFTRLIGTWPGIGRIDQMLGGYLKKDLAEGTITLDEAREILSHLFIKGCEWIETNSPRNSGDAQHYQNIVLAGLDENGEEVCNEVTYLVLDIVEELGISDFPITIRLREDSPELLLRRAAEVIRHGGGVVAAYNETLILQAFADSGYPREEALRFANDGCWEVQVPGKTNFSYNPFDGLSILLDDCFGLNSPKENEDDYHLDSFADFDWLFERYCDRLKYNVDEICRQDIEWLGKISERTGEWMYWDEGGSPCSVVSLFEDDCIETGRGYHGGGARYYVRSPHIGGLPDIANSLYAVKKLVYEEKKVTLPELIGILRDNWDGHEELRSYVFNRYRYYGNDNDEVDLLAAKLLDRFADMVLVHNGESPIRLIPGVSTFGRQIDWHGHRSAVPFGRRRGDILAGNDSPTPGTDLSGVTAVIKSYCKADLVRQRCGAALDLRLHPTAVRGEEGIAGIVGLLKGFLHLGGFFVQVDSVDAQMLREAQKNPQDYKSLSVRVSGWNARFVTLNEDWQRMVIERTELGF